MNVRSLSVHAATDAVSAMLSAPPLPGFPVAVQVVNDVWEIVAEEPANEREIAPPAGAEQRVKVVWLESVPLMVIL